jgi:protein-S-isoprenylcysteine O-methyltransferase Ste14
MKINTDLLFSFLINIIFLMLSIYKLVSWRASMLGAGIILVLLYVLWSMFEAFRSNAKKGEQIKSRSLDKKTFDYYLFARLLTIYSALLIPAIWSRPGIWMYIGIVFFLIGILLRFAAMKALGDFYSHWVRIREDHRIIGKGPYKIIRHPSYLGMLLAHLGFVIFFFNIISISAYCLLFVPTIIRRIIVEEKVLCSLEEYRKYSEGRERIIPFIW